jgi:hypothetical protein
VFTQTIPALFAGGDWCVVGAFAVVALTGGALAEAGWLDGAAGAVAGAAVADFAGALAGEAAVGTAGEALADFADFVERVFWGAALSELAAAEVDAAAEPSVEAVPFFERDFLGAAELSAAALLSAASVFFDVLFFLEDAALESEAA